MLVRSLAAALLALPAILAPLVSLAPLASLTSMTSAAPPAAAATLTASSPPLTLTWSKVTTPVAPPPLSGASAVYDSDNRTVVMFGGRTASGTLSDDTWVWDGSSWTDYRASDVQAPPPRESASMAFDPPLHQLILFGGLGASGQPLGDTWAWNGASWYEESGSLVSQSPDPRQGAAMSNDANGNLVLFGGTGSSQPPPPATSTTTPPDPVAPTSTTTTTGPTATTSGSTSSASPGSPAPVSLTSANAGTLGDTWLWTANGWTSDPVAGPSARTGAAMAFDPSANETILTGGEGSAAGAAAPPLLADTWKWNGTAWSKLAPRSAPPGRSDATLTGDPLTRGLVLFGGSGTHGTLGDTWLWNGTSWSDARVGGAPPARTGAAAAFDSDRSELVVFGGTGAGGATLGDTQVLTDHAPLVLGTGRAPTSPSGLGTSSTTYPPATRGHQAAVIPAAGAPPATSPTPAGSSSGGSGSGSSLHVTTHRLHRGDLVTLTGAGFRPGSSITILFHSTLTFVGRATAGTDGQFSATVPVPESASGGLHHFEATGRTSSGQDAELVTAVEIVGVPSASPTALQTGVLVALALLLPAGTWGVLAAAGWWRRRGGLAT